MATTIKLKNGSGAPLAGDLVQGEPALDLTNKRLYTEDSGGSVIEVGTSPSTIDINAGTIDGTVIGGSSAAAGTFTTFTSTGIDDNATSTAITIDASENVGIGTSSPTAVLALARSNNFPFLHWNDSTDNSNVAYAGWHGGTGGGNDFRIGTVSTTPLTFYANANERMRIDASGNVGIGTDSPSSVLTSAPRKGSDPTANSTITGLNLYNGQANVTGDGVQLLFDHSFATPGSQSRGAYIRTISNTIFSGEVSLAIGTSVGDSFAERMRIAANGNVGIGTTNPTTLIEVKRNTTSGTTGFFPEITATNTNAAGVAGFRANGANGAVAFQLTALADRARIATLTNQPLTFMTSGIERMRIDASGNLLVGRTSTVVSATDYGMNLYSSGILYLFANAAGNDDIFRGHNSAGTNTSAIEADGDYIDLSDSRFKQNIVDAPSVINTIKSISVRSFDWKDRNYGQTYGFVAQELYGICPEVVKVPESEEDVWGVRNSKVVPMLVKAVQEQQAMIEELKAEVAALKGA